MTTSHQIKRGKGIYAYNTAGLTHFWKPNMFNLSICGLHLTHKQNTDTHRTFYAPCPKCHQERS